MHQAQLSLSRPTVRANFVPALPITRAVSLDILRQGMQRKMRRGEGEEMKERFIAMLLLMLLEHSDRVIGNGVRGIKLRADRRGRLALVIEEMKFQPKEPVVVDVVRAIKPVGQRHAVHVPFAGVIGAVPGRLEHHRQQPRPLRPIGPPLSARMIAPHLLRVVAGQNRRPRRPTACRVVKLCVPQAVLRQPIQMRRFNLATVTAQIRVPQVIGHDHQYIRRLGVNPV